MGGTSSNVTDVLIRKEYLDPQRDIRDAYAHGKGHMSQREKAAIYKPKRDISWENSPANTLDS